MRDPKYWASAAFYVLALAAQVSGITSTPIASLLAFAATVLLVVALWHTVSESRQRRGKSGLRLGPLYFIVAGLLIAAGGVGWQFYQIAHPKKAPFIPTAVSVTPEIKLPQAEAQIDHPHRKPPKQIETPQYGQPAQPTPQILTSSAAPPPPFYLTRLYGPKQRDEIADLVPAITKKLDTTAQRLRDFGATVPGLAGGQIPGARSPMFMRVWRNSLPTEQNSKSLRDFGSVVDGLGDDIYGKDGIVTKNSSYAEELAAIIPVQRFTDLSEALKRDLRPAADAVDHIRALTAPQDVSIDSYIYLRESAQPSLSRVAADINALATFFSDAKSNAEKWRDSLAKR